jgi:hypothetical protein
MFRKFAIKRWRDLEIVTEKQWSSPHSSYEIA